MQNRILHITIVLSLIIVSGMLSGFNSVNLDIDSATAFGIAQDDQPTPEEPEPAPEEPEPEQPVATEPVAGQPPDSGSGSQPLSTGVLIGLLIAAGVVILVVIGYFMGRGQKKDEPPQSPGSEPPASY